VQGNGAARETGADRRGVLALIRALADSGLDLLHNTARMAASEGRVVLHRLTVRLGILLAGLLVAAAGLLLALVGAALLLTRLSGVDDWLAFVLVGGAALAAGALLAVRAMARLSEPDLAFPATLEEFRADVEALRGEGRP
jgi:hypothetical protein